MSGYIVAPERNDCPFCRYLRGERVYTILRHTGSVATLVTREQRGVGHLLVVPVRHAPTILDLSFSELQELIVEVGLMAHLLDECYHRPGIAVWQNNGISARQTVGHVHFHIAGTQIGGGTEFGPVRELGIAETEDIAEELRAAMASLGIGEEKVSVELYEKVRLNSNNIL